MNSVTTRIGKYLFGPTMFWTVLTSLFAWLPLVRIIGRPEGYRWAIGGLSGTGMEGPFWVFILATAYALVLLFSAYRGPRMLFYPMLILWHVAVTAGVVAGVVSSGPDAAMQGQGLGLAVPLWAVAIPCFVFTLLAIAWIVVDSLSGARAHSSAWTRRNSILLGTSLLLLLAALALFRAGTNYNWVTAAAIAATIFHWILLAESFQPANSANIGAGHDD